MLLWGDPQVNKFEDVSSVGHQMSVAGGRVRGPRSDGWGGGGRSLKSDVGGGSCTAKSKVSRVMVIWGPSMNRQNERHT